MNVRENNMRGEWNLRDWERTYWQVFFEKEIEKLESDSIKAVDLTKEDAQKGHEN